MSFFVNLGIIVVIIMFLAALFPDKFLQMKEWWDEQIRGGDL